MKDFFSMHYKLVKDSRTVLFNFCSTVSNEHFVKEVEGFGRGGSMRNLLVHVANSYQYWIVAHCFSEKVNSLVYEAYPTLEDCLELYEKIDEYVYRLISLFESDYLKNISSINGDKTFVASPFKVYSHVTTHEYHHKGQVLSIARQHGYIPVDTDIIR